MGYCLPFVVTAWASRHIPRQSGPLLDAGCGTGLSGPCLAALGYAPIEGLDSSRDMLELAAGRGVYADLRRAELGRALPWQDDHFAGFVSSGVFTEGHAPASGLEAMRCSPCATACWNAAGSGRRSCGWNMKDGGGRSRKASLSGRSCLRNLR
jgi:SAM-dependent methyltransferase